MKKLLYIALFSTVLFSCESLIEADIPEDDLLEEDALLTATDFQQLLNSSYDVLANYHNGKMQRIAELLSDNIAAGFDDTGGFYDEVYRRNTNFFNSDVGSLFNDPYYAIARCNILMEEIDNIEIPAGVRAKMIAEARFIRAVAHFDLVNLWAHLPGYTADNSHLGIPLRDFADPDAVLRSTVGEVYDLIKSDLRYAEANLPESNGVYATSYAAQGFLAKVYFNEHNYDSTIYYTSQLVDPGTPFRLTGNISARYTASITSEHIFYSFSTGPNDVRSNVFRDDFRSDQREPRFKVTEDLFALIGNDPVDERAEWFTEVEVENAANYYVVNKFNIDYFNVAMIHVVDMLLTRAEAYAIQGLLPEAMDDVNAIRDRAGIPNISAASNQQQVLDAIRRERRIEMSFEGDRAIDLKRRGASGEDLTIRGAEWDCPGMLLQFPAVEGVPGFTFNEEGGCN